MVEVDKWIYCVSNKEAFWECEDKDKLSEEQNKLAKDAQTVFKFKSYDQKSDTSIIKYIF